MRSCRLAALGDPERPAAKSQRGQELEVVAHRHRDPSVHSYIHVSDYVSNEVMATREAILAENVARDRYLRNRESLSDLGATSLICAPILFGERVLGLIHLYCTDPHKALDAEDLEFTVAVAKQMGSVIHQLQKQSSLSAANLAAAGPAEGRERAGRHEPGDEDPRVADRPRRRDQRHVPDPRRKRLGQGAGGAGHPLFQPAPRRSVRLPQLRRPHRDAAGERAVRPRERRLHRRHREEDRQVRGGRTTAPSFSTKSAR